MERIDVAPQPFAGPAKSDAWNKHRDTANIRGETGLAGLAAAEREEIRRVSPVADPGFVRLRPKNSLSVCRNTDVVGASGLAEGDTCHNNEAITGTDIYKPSALGSCH